MGLKGRTFPFKFQNIFSFAPVPFNPKPLNSPQNLVYISVGRHVL